MIASRDCFFEKISAKTQVWITSLSVSCFFQVKSRFLKKWLGQLTAQTVTLVSFPWGNHCTPTDSRSAHVRSHHTGCYNSVLLKGWDSIQLMTSLFHRGPIKWNWHLKNCFLPCVHDCEEYSDFQYSAVLIWAKVPAVLFTVAFAPLLQRREKRQITSLYHYENSFDFLESLKRSWRPQGPHTTHFENCCNNDASVL